jgi:hypothetical protein
MTSFTQLYISSIRSLLFLLLLLLVQQSPSHAQIACNATYNPCEELLFKGSECRDGFCSNPFEKGCLNTLLQEEFGVAGGDDQPVDPQTLLPSLARRLRNEIRVCNSEDTPDAIARGICVDHTTIEHKLFDEYVEVRILSQNWESAFFSAWLMQILLTEVLRVPTTIESGTADAKVNFYSPTNDLGYGVANDWSAIETANAAPNGDCTRKGESKDDDDDAQQTQSPNATQEEGDGYQSCGHVITELWGDTKDLWIKHREGISDAPEGLGAIGAQALFGNYPIIRSLLQAQLPP